MTEEITIIKRVINGDVDSFRILVERYQRPVMSMINNFLADRHLCEDIAQDVFFTAYRKLKTFDQAQSNFSTWLFTIARNKSINALKKRKIVSLGPLPQKADLRNPADQIGQKEFFDRLDQILANLPGRQKRAFVLAEFEELPYDQIAQIEGIKIGTVKSRINRAKKKLKSALKKLEEAEA